MGQTARVFFWSFIALYFLLSLFVVLVFLASVSDVDGIDFLIGVLTAVARTILLTPWVGVTFFLLFIACVEVGWPCRTKSEAHAKKRGKLEDSKWSLEGD